MLTQRQQPPMAADEHALVEVDRAATDLRRGAFVLLRTPDTALLVVAAEAVSDAALAQLRSLAGVPLALAITHRRAAVLGLAEPPTGPGGSVLLSVPEGTPASLLCDLADPSTPTTPRLPVAVVDATTRIAASD